MAKPMLRVGGVDASWVIPCSSVSVMGRRSGRSFGVEGVRDGHFQEAWQTSGKVLAKRSRVTYQVRKLEQGIQLTAISWGPYESLQSCALT